MCSHHDKFYGNLEVREKIEIVEKTYFAPTPSVGNNFGSQADITYLSCDLNRNKQHLKSFKGFRIIFNLQLGCLKTELIGPHKENPRRKTRENNWKHLGDIFSGHDPPLTESIHQILPS